MNILYILHTMIRNIYAQYAFILDYSKARSKKDMEKSLKSKCLTRT